MIQYQTYTTFEVLERLPLLDALSLIEMRTLVQQEADTYTLLEQQLISGCLAVFLKIALEEELLKKQIETLQATFFFIQKRHCGKI